MTGRRAEPDGLEAQGFRALVANRLEMVLGLAARLSTRGRSVFVICGIFGAVAFVVIYGIHVLDFGYTDWLLRSSGDITAQYTGWLFFRNSSWQFPIGLVDGIVYPSKISVIYSDPIPLFALIFKLLSPVLPSTFQYFGLYGLLCFILQGAISGLIIFRLSNNAVFALVCAPFFILLPALIFRMFFHTALAGHFVLLLAIWLCITKEDGPRSRRRATVAWSALICLATLIQAYFVPMVLLFAVFYFLDDFIASRSVRAPLSLFVCLIPWLLVVYLLGAFYGSTQSAGTGLGNYSANILSLVMDQSWGGVHWSRFLRPSVLATGGQYEGFAYLGLGMILLVFLALVAIVKKAFNSGVLALFRHRIDRKVVLGTILVVVFFVIALSPRVTFGSHTLFTYHLPTALSNLWSIFRCSGRFMWVPGYVIMFVALWAVSREYRRVGAAIVAFCLLLQVGDIYRPILTLGQEVQVISSPLQPLSQTWDQIGSRFKHIDFLMDPGANTGFFFPFGVLAYRFHITTSNYYVSRPESTTIAEYRDAAFQSLENGLVDNSTVYILDPGQVFELTGQRALSIYFLDNKYVAFTSSFKLTGNDVSPIAGLGLSVDVTSHYGANQKNSSDLPDGSRVVHAGGSTWSRSMELPAGSYTFTWTGEGMGMMDCSLAYGSGGDSLPIRNVLATDQLKSFSVDLSQNISQVSATCVNQSSSDVLVKSVIAQETA